MSSRASMLNDARRNAEDIEPLLSARTNSRKSSPTSGGRASLPGGSSPAVGGGAVVDLDGDTSADYETAISRTGYGRFHWLFGLTCGWANAADAVEILAISFLLPAAQCDLKLTSRDKGNLSAILFVGMMLGGYLWGCLGDHLGRRSILISAMFINAICGFMSSLAQDKATFFVFRFLSGIGVGGSIPVVWSYFAEFQPKHLRGRMLSVLASFWMVGNVTVAGLAWLVIPLKLGTDLSYDDSDELAFQFNSWRVFTLLSGVPALIVAFALFFFPESPKFLISRGRSREALSVFANIYSINTGKPARSYPIKRLTIEVQSETSARTASSSWLGAARKSLQSTLSLFKPALVKTTTVMIAINFAIQFGYYGLWLWFPELFTKLESYHAAHPNSTDVTVCDVAQSQGSRAGEDARLSAAAQEDSAGLFSEQDPFCNEAPTSEVFMNSFLISISALPGNVWTIWKMDSHGRKFFLVMSMLLSGLSAFGIFLVTSSSLNLLLSCVFGAVSTMGFSSLDCLGIELFPTHLRSSAMGVTLAAARLGAILGNEIFGIFVDSSCAFPILSVAVLLVGGGLLSLTLPNTTKTPLA